MVDLNIQISKIMKVEGAKIDTHIDQARYLYAKDKAIDQYKIF